MDRLHKLPKGQVDLGGEGGMGMRSIYVIIPGGRIIFHY